MTPGKYRTRHGELVELIYFKEKAHFFPGKVKRQDDIFYTVTHAGKRMLNTDDPWDLMEKLSD